MMIKDSTNQELSVFEAIGYLGSGLKLALSPQCRMFVIIPILINIVVLTTGGYFVFTSIKALLSDYLNVLPEWLSFVSYILWFILFCTVGFVFCYIFSTVATIIASPFYGILAEKAEGLVRGSPFAAMSDDGIAAIIKDIPRILKRELQKLGFYLPRVLVCLIITLIPVVNVVAPICWFLLAAWMMSVQYCDYPYDNHKIPFADMRHDLSMNRLCTFAFGAVIALAMTVPVLNLLIPPAAVCAGTKYYVELRKRYTLDSALRNPNNNPTLQQ